MFCKKCLTLDVFPREDYKELTQLTVIWLGGVVKDFQFQWPGPVHHARFMAKAIYYLKMQLVSNFVTIFSEEERKEISSMSEFVGVFYSHWFLRCAMSTQAPRQDLLAISQMRKYSAIRPIASEACLKSFSRHPWYLTEHLVIMSLADEDLEEDERKAVATALDQTERPEKFSLGKPKFPLVTADKFWDDISGTEMMGLAKLVGPRSWMIPGILGLGVDEMVWLKLEVYQWYLVPGYKKFHHFVKNLTVVNDPAERGVKLIQVRLNENILYKKEKFS